MLLPSLKTSVDCRAVPARSIGLGFLCGLALLTSVRLDAAEPGESGVVTGVLVRADGSPLPAANVLLRGNKLYQARSDTEGRFGFQDIPAGNYQLWAHQENLVSGKHAVRLVKAADADRPAFAPLRLTMNAGKRIRFSITSADTGKPLEGAVVRFAYPDRRKAVTMDDGTAVVEGLLPERYEITIERSEHARALRHMDLSQSEEVTELAVSLAAGGSVRGVVSDERGQPLAGVDVVYREPGSGSGFYGDSPRTDESGNFRHNYLPLNTTIEVSFRKEGYLTLRREIGLSAQMREQQVDLHLQQRPPGGSIAGVVKDLDGKAIAGATVSNFGNGAGQERKATTDDHGAFVLHDLLTSSTGHEIIVRAKGFAPLRKSVQPGPPTAPADVSLTLQPGHAIKGRVVNERGLPIERATVAVNGHRLPGGIGDHEQTDDEGRFEFDSLPENSKFQVYAPGYSSRRDVSLPFDGAEPVTIPLETAGAIRGQVTDADSGQPIPQFSVRVGSSRQFQDGDVRGSYSSTLAEGIAVKSKEGLFVLKELTNRMPLEITVEAEGYQKSVLPRVVAAPLEKAEPVAIELKRFDSSRTFTLLGQIVDHQGKGIAGAQLRLIVSSQPARGYNDNDYNWILVKTGQLARRGHCDQFLSLVSDAQGRFEFNNILPGKYLQLAFWGSNVIQGRSLQFERTTAGASQTATIQLPKPAKVIGTIAISEFQNAGRIKLSRPQEAWHDYEQTLAEGQTEFRFDNLPPGEYLVFVQSKPVRSLENEGESRLYGLAQQTFMLQEGETKRIHFEEPERRIER